MSQQPASADDQGPTVPVVPVGAAIYSRDGVPIGLVKAVRDDQFLVEVRWAFDYWLSTRCVATVAGAQVLLAVDKEAVSDYLVDGAGSDVD
jgi:hypothetical protein